LFSPLPVALGVFDAFFQNNNEVVFDATRRYRRDFCDYRHK